jgi:hypothetical protein
MTYEHIDKTAKALLADYRRRNPPARKPHVHGEETRAAIIARCRDLMTAGTFRPVRKQLLGDGVRPKALKYHYPNLQLLYIVALDEPTSTKILSLLMPNGPWPAADDCARVVRAAVNGRLVR